MIDLNIKNFTAQNGFVILNDDGGAGLCSESKIFGQKFYGEQEKFIFTLSEETKCEEFFVLEYNCIGLRRQLSFRKPFIFAITENGEEPLVCLDDITMDNRRHQVIVKVNYPKCKGIKLEYSIDRRKKAEFTVHNMYFCKKSELPVACQRLITDKKRDFKKIDIKNLYNAESGLLKNDVLIDGGRFWEDGEAVICEIPFDVLSNGKNVIAPPPPPKENDDMIVNFGVPAKRRLCRPISRDSVIEVNIGREITEAFFLMEMSGMRHQRWGFASDGTILGTYCGDVTMPLLIDDTEGFMAEIIYADGKRDTALPLNLSLKRHGVAGDMSAYAVPCDGSRVEKIVFHNRKLDSTLSLVALTVNDTEERMFPEMVIPQMPQKTEHKIGNKKEITLKGNELTLENGALSMKIDISSGMKLLEMKNAFIPKMTAKSCEMLKFVSADKEEFCGFELVCAKAEKEKAEIVYKKDALKITISAELLDENDIKWQMNAENISGDDVRQGIIFPCISGINHENSEDNWYFFPKYQNINSNETAFIYEESAPSFPMQFFDVYSKNAQGGLSVTTKERGLVTRKYALSKDEDGIEFYVEYPEMYGDIAKGEIFNGSPTVFTAHEGDWRKSYKIYKKWVDSWYEPYKCQDKQWYRECFWLLAEIPDFFETTEFIKLPCWYNEEKKEFNFEKILEEQKEIAGCYPDILHLWSWTNKFDEDGKFWQQWGNFGSTDYDKYGGVEKFRKALNDVREKKGVNVSLYLHPTLLSGQYPQAKEFFPKYKVVNDIGENISIAGDSYRMCHANEEWRNHAVSMYPRVYDELGIPLLYVDEWSLRIENRCYGEGHGHSVPSSLLKTDRDFIKQLKDTMPEEVVLYGEYAAVDVNARYIDCNISYYIIDSVVDMIETAWRACDGDDSFSRVFTDVYRFAFPKVVQLILPMAMRNLSWHPQKFLFFNGEAIYDSFWDCEESAGLDFTIKAYKLKKKYADCFTSDNPETMVDTLSPAICANRFPAENRTVYTIYNRAYVTFRGKAIKVPHEEGNVYYDAWNEKMLDVEIKDGFAEIYLTVDAQQMGCIEIRK